MQPIAILKVVNADDNIYSRPRQTLGNPRAPSRSQFESGADKLPGGSTSFANVPAGVAEIGDLVLYQDQYFQIDGIIPMDPYGAQVELTTSQVPHLIVQQNVQPVLGGFSPSFNDAAPVFGEAQ